MTADIVRRDLLDPATGLRCDVADIDGRVAGYTLHIVSYETAFAARGRYMSDLYVDEQARGRGVARALINALARQTREEGGRYLWWIAGGEDPGAKAFYEKIANVTDTVVSHAATFGNFKALVVGDDEDEGGSGA